MLRSWTDCMNKAAPGNDRVGTDLAFVERLQLCKHARGAGAVAAAGERSDGVNRGIFHEDGVELFELVGHGSEGDVLIALDVAVDASGGLLGEKAFGNGNVHVSSQDDGA